LVVTVTSVIKSLKNLKKFGKKNNQMGLTSDQKEDAREALSVI
jgi:hypothetical protein